MRFLTDVESWIFVTKSNFTSLARTTVEHSHSLKQLPSLQKKEAALQLKIMVSILGYFAFFSSYSKSELLDADCGLSFSE